MPWEGGIGCLKNKDWAIIKMPFYGELAWASLWCTIRMIQNRVEGTWPSRLHMKEKKWHLNIDAGKLCCYLRGTFSKHKLAVIAIIEASSFLVVMHVGECWRRDFVVESMREKLIIIMESTFSKDLLQTRTSWRALQHTCNGDRYPCGTVEDRREGKRALKTH